MECYFYLYLFKQNFNVDFLSQIEFLFQMLLLLLLSSSFKMDKYFVVHAYVVSFL